MKCLEGLCLEKCAAAKKSVESQNFGDAIFSICTPCSSAYQHRLHLETMRITEFTSVEDKVEDYTWLETKREQ